MKILYIITKSEIGGAQTHVLQLIRGMHERGYEIGLMCYPGGWLQTEAEKLGVTVYPNLYFKNTYNPVHIARMFRAIRKAVASFRPDMISLHSSMAGFLSRLAIRNRIPTIYTAHGFAFTDGAPIVRKCIAVIAEKIAAPFSSKIICVSVFDKELARRYSIAPDRKLAVVHNGITIGETDAKQVSSSIRIIFVGRLAYPKETELLIQSFTGLAPHVRGSATLHVVGDGPQLLHLQQAVEVKQMQGSVVFHGAVDPKDVKVFLHTSDIFILLSKHEGFPMTILEAMEAGLPVVASNVGGIPEQIDVLSGILVANTVSDVQHALSVLIQDSEMRQKMGDGARQRVIDQFSMQKFLAETERVYREVVMTVAASA